MKKTLLTLLFALIVLLIPIDLLAQGNAPKSKKEFNTFMSSMQSNGKKQGRYNYALNYFSNHRTTVFELEEACYYMPNDKVKYRLCVAAYPGIVDKNNFFSIYDAFSSFSYAMMLYHNTQAKDGNFDPNDSPGEHYDSIIFPSCEDYIGLTGVNCSAPMSKSDFNYLFNNLRFNNDDDQQLMYLKQQVSTHCFSVAQIMTLGLELQLERNRLKFLKFSLDRCFDMKNFSKSLQVINHTYYKEDLRQYIDDHFRSISQLPTQEPSPVNDCFVSNGEFAHVMTSIKDQTFPSKQKVMAKKYIAKKCFSTEQLLKIVSIFKFSSDKLDVVMYLYDYAPELDKMYMFRDALEFNSTQRKFDNFLLDQH